MIKTQLAIRVIDNIVHYKTLNFLKLNVATFQTIEGLI